MWDIPGLDKYHGQDIFLTEALTIEANRAMDDAVADGKPFFLYMAHYTVHTPYAVDSRFSQKSREAGLGHKTAMYSAMIEGMDKSRSHILANLARPNVPERRLVQFNTDNTGIGSQHPPA